MPAGARAADLPPITAHARDQCEERYGFRPTFWQAAFAVFDITECRSLLLVVQPPGWERHRVRLGPAEVTVVYDPHRALIVTVLPPEPSNLAQRLRPSRGGPRPAAAATAFNPRAPEMTDA